MCVIIKEPSECSEREIEDFLLLLKKSGEVSLNGLKNRIKKARCLAFYYEKDELSGIVGLKRLKNHKNRIFKSAGVSEEADKYSLEIGWAYTNPTHRGRGICTTLTQKILGKFESESFYATARTDNVAIHKVLEKTGFKRIGKPYQGRANNYIQLLIRPRRGNA